MPAYTDDQIKTYAQQLGAKGASPEDIEQFVSSAKGVPLSITPAATSYLGTNTAGGTPAMSLHGHPLPGMANPSQANLPGYTPDADNPFALRAQVGGQEAIQSVANAAKNLGLEGGGVALGQTLGAPFAEFGGVQIGGAIGGMAGNAAAQLTSPGSFKMGQMIGAGGVGAIPGSFLEKPGISLAKKALVLGGANVAAGNTASLIDTGKFSSLPSDMLQFGAGAIAAPIAKMTNSGENAANTSRKFWNDEANRTSINMAKELGLVFPPPATNPSALNETMNSLAGKAATAQEAVIRNQPVVNSIVRGELGIPEGNALSLKSLNTAKVGPNQAYEDVSKMTPQSAGLLGAFKAKQAEANMAFGQFRADSARGVYNPSVRQQGEVLLSEAQQFKDALKNEAATVPNGQELMDNFDAASQKLAKIALAEQALHHSSGNIDASVIGDAFEFNPNRLTGDMLKLGRSQSVFNRYVKDATSAIPSGVNQLRMMAKLGALAGGVASGHAEAGLVAPLAMEAAERGAKSAILSPFYQRNFTAPYYGSNLPDTPSQIFRAATMASGRQN